MNQSNTLIFSLHCLKYLTHLPGLINHPTTTCLKALLGMALFFFFNFITPPPICTLCSRHGKLLTLFEINDAFIPVTLLTYVLIP